jgi:LysR family transcriptional regulator, hca operon transcriptional activator
MPSDHRLTERATIRPEDFAGEPFILATNKAAVLNWVIERYLHENGINVMPEHGVDNLAMAVSLVASTRGLAPMPEYANNLLPWSVVSRALEGEALTIDLVIGNSKSNTSPVLELFLSRVEELTASSPENRGAPNNDTEKMQAWSEGVPLPNPKLLAVVGLH